MNILWNVLEWMGYLAVGVVVIGGVLAIVVCLASGRHEDLVDKHLEP